MAVFSLPIADEDVPRVVGALCANFGYADVTYVNALAGVMAFISDLVTKAETVAAQQAAVAAVPDATPVSFVDDTPPTP
jgi:hypothetical protein